MQKRRWGTELGGDNAHSILYRSSWFFFRSSFGCCWWILILLLALWINGATASTGNSLQEESELLVYNVLVYGATPSGIIASVTAARILREQHNQIQNPKVLLLNPNNHVGGMVAGGLGQSDIGFYADQVIGGLAQEFFERVALRYKQESTFQPRAPWNIEPHVAESVFFDLLQEAGVTIVLNAGYVKGVSFEGTDWRLYDIQTVPSNTNNATSLFWKANVFIDASYEGDLMDAANVTSVVGREGENAYGESYAGNLGHNDGHVFPVPVNPYINDDNHTLLPYLLTPSPEGSIGDADTKIQSYNFRLCVTNITSNRVPFEEPSNYEPERWELMRRYVSKLVSKNKVHQFIKVPTPNLGPLANGKFDCNNGGPISTDFVGGSWAYPKAFCSERAAIWEAHKQYTLEFFWFLKTDNSVPLEIRNEIQNWGLCADEFKSSNHWPPQLYVREGRRMLGTKVFTQKSIEDQATNKIDSHDIAERIKDIGLESIGLGSYRYDSHTAQRVPTVNKKHESKTKNEGDLQRSPNPPLYQIPYWVLLPPNRPNLLVSVCVSASHVAFSTLRMEPQFMILGQAAGTIAAMNSRHGNNVQTVKLDILRKHLLDMKQKVTLRRMSESQYW